MLLTKRDVERFSGSSRICNIEIEVVLTNLLKLLNEHGILRNFAFNGGLAYLEHFMRVSPMCSVTAA